MTSTNTYFQQIANHLNPTDLSNFIELFQLAMTGSNTQSQKKVFDTLKQVESKAQTYLYFLFIFLNPEYDQNLKYITGTTMKSALQRNSKELHFEQHQRNLMKSALLSSSVSTQKLKSTQNILISQMAFCFEQIDWQLIYFLVNKIQQNHEILPLLFTIFEDLKHHRQNYAYFEGAVQIEVIQALFKSIHELMCQTLKRINFAQSQNFQQQLKTLTECFRVIRIITFHLPLKLSPYLMTYVDEVVVRILKNLSNIFSKQHISMFLSKGNHFVMKNFVIEIFESINEISETKFEYLLQHKQFLDQFVMYFPINCEQFRKNFHDVLKIWTNTILELLINDQLEENQDEQEEQNYHRYQMFNYTEVIFSRVLAGFRFTKQDQMHILNQMELEHNPYNIEQPLNSEEGQNGSDDEGNYEASHGKAHGSTLRKVSITCVEKLTQKYKNVFWQITKPILYQLLKNESDYKIQQTAVVFVGIVAENCPEQIMNDGLTILSELSKLPSRLNHDIVLASTLWAFEKLIPTFSGSTDTKKFVYETIYKVMGNQDEYSNLAQSKNLMVKEAAVSLLDEMLSQETQLDDQVIKIMLDCLMHALQKFTGRALFNVFKAISTIFQLPQRQGIESGLVGTAIKYLCIKWSTSVQKDSIMCPLIECLSYICENRKQYFIEYSIEILTQIYPLFKETAERKSLVLRVIDLATAIIVGAKEWPLTEAYKNIRSIVSSQEFLLTVNSLILSQEKEVRHFGYGLLSDIVKLGGVSNEKAFHFIQTIAQTMDRINSTSINNALMCLTDIIDCHREVGCKYCRQILQVIVEFVEKFPSSNLPKIYLLNFSRMFGRLAHVDMASAKQLCIHRRGFLKYISQGLRSQEKSQLTLSAYQGIILLIISMSQPQLTHLMETKEIEHIIDSFMGYKHNLQTKENMDYIKIVFEQMRKLLETRNIAWSQYLNSTILYPATINRILQILN